MNKNRFVLLMLLFICKVMSAQTPLSMQDALRIATDNYETIKAKKNYLKASEATEQTSKREYLPDLRFSAQQSYGTINAQNGPMHSFGGLGVASTSMPLAEQNWNAAFGALYLANINWDFFTFGQISNNIKFSRLAKERTNADLQQEIFQHQIRTVSAYLNLLAIQRMVFVQQKNVERAEVFLITVQSLADNELKPMVDASLAQAEVSNAKISLIKIQDKELELSKVLSVLLGIDYTKFQLDDTFSKLSPTLLSPISGGSQNHPVLAYKQSIIDHSNGQVKLLKSQNMPRFSLFGVLQGRGSGFEYNYVQDNSAFSRKYANGVGIDRTNYLIGVGVTWNFTSLFRNHSKIKRQRFTSSALMDEYKLLENELKAQSLMADGRILNALDYKKESPVQVKAASEAYQQHLALYKNGLTTIADLTQSFYSLNRAETDNEIAIINLWQALLLKASSVGDIHLFINEIDQ
jgi:outer membrane protein TolC